MRATLLVLIIVGGCAPGFTSVSSDAWQTVPAAQRAAIDAAYQSQVAQARAELQAASAPVVAPRLPALQRATVAVAPGDDWAGAMRTFERTEADARTQIAAATAAVQRADAQYRAERVALATAQLVELRCAHELARARAVDHNLLGDDTYDTAGFRGQLARAQEPRYAAAARADVARAALQHATAGLAAAKETYAALVRRGPTAPTSSDTALRLTDWTPVARGWRWHQSATTTPYLNRPRLAIR